jgi:hypothetical protein
MRALFLHNNMMYLDYDIFVLGKLGEGRERGYEK